MAFLDVLGFADLIARDDRLDAVDQYVEAVKHSGTCCWIKRRPLRTVLRQRNRVARRGLHYEPAKISGVLSNNSGTAYKEIWLIVDMLDSQGAVLKKEWIYLTDVSSGQRMRIAYALAEPNEPYHIELEGGQPQSQLVTRCVPLKTAEFTLKFPPVALQLLRFPSWLNPVKDIAIQFCKAFFAQNGSRPARVGNSGGCLGQLWTKIRENSLNDADPVSLRAGEGFH